MPQRKPRSRKGAAAGSRAPAGRGRIGPLWWGAGLLALGWIAFDANRPAVERHIPQLAALRLPWEAAEPAPPRREVARKAPVATAPARPSAASPPAERPAARPERPAEPRTAALRPAAPPAKPVIPLSAPRRGEPAAARPMAAAPDAGRTLPAAGSSFTTRGPTPLRRSPSAGAPVWMVLDAGRPLRVTRREGGFARVESGIFTGWVDAAVVPNAAVREAAVPEAAARAAPPRAAAMPTLAAAHAGRLKPVPSASVPAPTR